MRKFLPAVLIFSLLPACALGGTKNIIGFYKTEPEYGGAWKRMCVNTRPDKRFEVYISAGYCPSEECMNYRPDNVTFEGTLKGNAIHYSNSAGCKLKVSFDSRGATVKQNDPCRNDDHPYLYANGYYKFIKPEAGEGDCGP